MNEILSPTDNQKLQRWAGLILALLFVVALALLAILKHNAFNTRIYDFARFSQAIWNTLDGRFLYETITNRSILRNHFSPIMAAVSPLLLLWPNERLLFVVQALNAAVAGLILYRLFPQRHSWLGLGFLLAFYLNPDLHSVTLFEFRRIVFAMPWLALAMVSLVQGRRWLMLLGLLIALLAKESVGLYIASIGLYLLLFERDWRWGVGLIALGGGLTLLISTQITTSEGSYSQLYYYSDWGNNYEEIVTAWLTRPLVTLQQMFQPPQWQAIGRILLPLGLILPFWGRGWRYVIIFVPYVALMFLSNDVDMYQLDKWYMATVLPVLFTAIAVGWRDIPAAWQRPVMGYWLGMTLLGYVLFSPAPGGGEFEPQLYQMDDYDRLGAQFLERIPPSAALASQSKYIPHLTHLAELRHYPWLDLDKIDYLLLDRYSSPYPFDEQGINEEISNLVADPSYVVVQEAEGLHLLQTQGEPLPSFEMGYTAEESIHLPRLEVARATPDDPFFQPLSTAPLTVQPGDTLRVSLYWEALRAPHAERTVSVRVADEIGFLLTQHDSLPVGGRQPTSWWEAGHAIRDVYYLTLPPDVPLGRGALDLVLYDTYTLEIVRFADQGDILPLLPLEIVPSNGG